MSRLALSHPYEGRLRHNFGVTLGPCTFAYMAPMLGVTFSVSGTNVGFGVLLIAAYGLGHCSVIVLAGASTRAMSASLPRLSCTFPPVRRYLQWTEASRGTTHLRYASGVLVLAGGLYLLYTA